MDAIKNILTITKKKKSLKKVSEKVPPNIPVIEVPETEEPAIFGKIEPIYVKSFDLTSVVDIREVSRELRDGNIAILNISPLMEGTICCEVF